VEQTTNPDSVQSLVRGLHVLTAFNRGKARMTLSEIAVLSDLSRGTTRRLLLTLVEIGYVGVDGKFFFLRPQLLELGYSYLSTLSFNDIVQKHLNLIADQLHESASASVLVFPDVVYVARASTNRLMTIGLSVGSKLPALYTSMGRVMLAQLTKNELENHLAGLKLNPPTAQSIKTLATMRKELEKVRRDGYCILDQELETGLRSIGVAIGSHINGTYAAINVSVPASRISIEDLKEKICPLLQSTAKEINKELGNVWPN
jgi:IclR family transcriptional regulator, pca regulon regulatory protein